MKPRPQKNAGKGEIREPGRFCGVRLYTDAVFQPIRDVLAEKMAQDLEAGYRWCTEQLKAALRSELRCVGDEISLHIRKRLPKEIAELVSLYVLVGEAGLYLTDEESRRQAFLKASRRPLAVRESPVTLSVDFAAKVLRAKEMFSKEALRRKRTIRRSISRAPYKQTRFDLAERAVLRYDDLAVKPLVWEGPTLLVVGFPTSLIDPLDKILEHEKPELARLLRIRAKDICRVMKHLEAKESRFWISPDLAAWGVRFLLQLFDVR